MAKGSLREVMPVTAKFLDDMREAFGKDHIDGIIRAGIQGKPVFFASENGHALGTPPPVGARTLKDERGNPYVVVEADGRVHRYVPGFGHRTKATWVKLSADVCTSDVAAARKVTA